MTPVRALGLCVILGLMVTGHPAHAGRGRVTYATEHWAFLDQGRADGLVDGRRVALVRHGHRVGRCRVEHVAEHHAACAMRGARSGDLAVFRGRAPRPQREALGKPPAPVSRAVARHFARLRIARVPFRGTFGAGNLTGMALAVDVQHQSWVGLAATATRYHRESVEISLAGIPIWNGFTASADATVAWWPDRPSNTRYRPDTPLQLFVWQTAVTRRAPGGLTLSAGRFVPWHTPGLTLLDGVQAGWAPASGTAEVGLYAGTLPDIMTLAPSTSQWTTGAYFSQRLGTNQAFRFSYEGRLAFTHYANDPARVETEVVTSTDIGSAVSADLDLRLALVGQTQPAPGVDAFRGSVTVRPADGISVRAGYRYLSPFAADADALFAWNVPGSRHLSASVSWALSPDLTLGVDGDGAWILDQVSTTRADIGPSVDFPHLFGEHGGVSLGVREGFGWTGGPVAWAQAILVAPPGLPPDAPRRLHVHHLRGARGRSAPGGRALRERGLRPHPDPLGAARPGRARGVRDRGDHRERRDHRALLGPAARPGRRAARRSGGPAVRRSHGWSAGRSRRRGRGRRGGPGALGGAADPAGRRAWHGRCTAPRP